jgi:hypothetical protein
MKTGDMIKRIEDARDAPVDLRPEYAMQFFCDESSQNAHRYLVIGVLAVMRSNVAEVEAALAATREKFKHDREIGWTCVSGYKFGIYEDWLDIFVSFAKRSRLRMTALILDTHIPANRGWSDEDPDLGFNKLIYHLLLHRVGKKYAISRRPIYGHLDSRTTRHKPEDLRRMLNGGLRNMGFKCNPFREIVFRDSKKSNLIQLVDLLAGGLAYARNQHGEKANARPHKIELSERICVTQMEIGQFDLWDWEFKHNR